jgi:hypothetical protein
VQRPVTLKPEGMAWKNMKIIGETEKGLPLS